MNPFFANLASIIVKDLAMDNVSPMLEHTKSYKLDEDEGHDEAFDFFLYLQNAHILEDSQFAKIQPASEFDLLDYTDVVFRLRLQLRKSTYVKIFECLQNVLRDQNNTINRKSAYKIYSIALWKLTNDDNFDDIGHKFGRSPEECQQMFHYFLDRLSDNYVMFVRWPSAAEFLCWKNEPLRAHNTLRDDFPLVFGVVGIKRTQVYMSNEQNFTEVVIQIVCNADKEIIDCFVEYFYQYSFDQSPIGRTMFVNSQVLPPGHYLIGNKCCPLRAYIIRPFQSPHSDLQRNFNAYLKQATDFCGEVLNAIAKRFHILKTLRVSDINEFRAIVEAACGIHNICIKQRDDLTLDATTEDVSFNWPEDLEEEDMRCFVETPAGARLRNKILSEFLRKN